MYVAQFLPGLVQPLEGVTRNPRTFADISCNEVFRRSPKSTFRQMPAESEWLRNRAQGRNDSECRQQTFLQTTSSRRPNMVNLAFCCRSDEKQRWKNLFLATETPPLSCFELSLWFCPGTLYWMTAHHCSSVQQLLSLDLVALLQP